MTGIWIYLPSNPVNRTDSLLCQEIPSPFYLPYFLFNFNHFLHNTVYIYIYIYIYNLNISLIWINQQNKIMNGRTLVIVAVCFRLMEKWKVMGILVNFHLLDLYGSSSVGPQLLYSSWSAIQNVRRILCNLKVQYRVYKNPPLISVWG